MAKPNSALTEIRAVAERLGAAHAETAAIAGMIQEEIRKAAAPILGAMQHRLDAAAEEQARAHDALDGLLIAAPHLFQRPRSLSVNGVRCGYRKEEDSLDWPDDEELVVRIGAVCPDLEPTLVRTQHSIVAEALTGLDAQLLRALGVRTIAGADRRFITIGDSDMEKLAKLMLADAVKRQGEDEVPRTKKGKAKIKEAA